MTTDILSQFDEELKSTRLEIITTAEMRDRIAAEIESLNARLRELQDNRRDTINKLTILNDKTRDIAIRKEKYLQEHQSQMLMEETANKVYEIIGDNNAWIKAHDYQKEDIIAYIHAYMSGFNGIMNANDMGLGKTMETLIALKILSVIFESQENRKPKILWLTKTAILRTGGTKREAARWYPDLKMAELYGNLPKAQREFFFEMIMDMHVTVITNYETVRTTENLKQVNWDFVIMDEVHKLKGGANLNGPTALWSAVKELCTNVRMIIMLTGTPMVNKPADMWAYLHIFDPDRFPKLREFEKIFSIYDYRTGEYLIDAEKLFQSALKGRVIRRAKKDVKLQLPEITPMEERELLVEMSGKQLDVYNQMRDRFYIWLEEMGDDTVLSAGAVIAQLTRLRQINIWPVINFTHADDPSRSLKLDVRESSKIDEAMDIIEEAGDQVVIFCTFNEPLYEIKRRCIEQGITCGVISGEHAKDMDHLEVDFQQGKIRVLCINSAMGEGLNLQKNPEAWPGGSSYAIFLDLWWNSARNDQCTDRVYRQGANEAVTVRHIKNVNSVDQFLDAIIEGKDRQIKGISEHEGLRPSEWKEFLKGKV